MHTPIFPRGEEGLMRLIVQLSGALAFCLGSDDTSQTAVVVGDRTERVNVQVCTRGAWLMMGLCVGLRVLPSRQVVTASLVSKNLTLDLPAHAAHCACPTEQDSTRPAGVIRP